MMLCNHCTGCIPSYGALCTRWPLTLQEFIHPLSGIVFNLAGSLATFLTNGTTSLVLGYMVLVALVEGPDINCILKKFFYAIQSLRPLPTILSFYTSCHPHLDVKIEAHSGCNLF